MITLMHCWNWFASILLRIFVSVFISDIGLKFFFLFLIILSSFHIRVMVASKNEFGSLPSSEYFENSFRRIDANYSLNIL